MTPDDLTARRVLSASGDLIAFNAAGILGPADLHAARRLTALTADDDPVVVLAAAFAVRAPRMGHVFVDLPNVAAQVAVEADEPLDTTLPWPDPDRWLAALRASPLVAVGDDEDDEHRPLRLVGTRVYLDRYWREERRLATDLSALRAHPVVVDEPRLDAGLRRLFNGDPAAAQARAARAALTHGLAVVAGGPGTGKTTTVARIAALLAEQTPAEGRLPLLALAAPTGKAAVRLHEAVRDVSADLDVEGAIREWLNALEASTLHRLLGWRPGSHSRFRHHRGRRLPYDAVIVDEASMVSLTLMARLLEALRPDTRLVLVGDPDQLTSVEAGAVLGDIVRAGEADRAVVALDRVHRFGSGIEEVATAVRGGDDDAAVAALAGAPEGVTWIATDAADGAERLAAVRDRAIFAGRAVLAAARAGDADAALTALKGFRLLCAHRRGPNGITRWARDVEGWLAADLDAQGTGFYLGRPLLMTENDYDLRLFNGDTGVVVSGTDGRAVAAFERGGQILEVRPSRLAAVETVYAMTIHKSQGSQFDVAAVLLPPPSSRILTRELLYTAITRARHELILVGTEETIRAAVQRPAARASGLAERLAS